MRDIQTMLEFFSMLKDGLNIHRFSNRKWAQPCALLEVSKYQEHQLQFPI